MEAKSNLLNAHYHLKAEHEQCRNRVYAPKVKEKLEQIATQARNQRLKLYNNHLWKLYSEAQEINDTAIIQIMKREHNNNFIKNAVKDIQQDWQTNRKELTDWVENRYEIMINTDPLELLDAVKTDKIDRQKTIEFYQNIKQKYSREYHLKICCEIAEFLTTKSSRYFWLNLLRHTIYNLRQFCNWDAQKFHTCYNKHPEQIKLGNRALDQIVNTPWIKVIRID